MGCEDCSSSDLNQEFHVLAVDDSLVDRKVIEKLFKISSCKVTAVESGSRALQYLGLDGDLNDANNSVGSYEGVKLNLIVTDYSMPGMTGFELLQKIKGSKALREIPVVVMSSENVLARIDRCLEEGAEEFLVKPVKLSDVKRLRDFVLRGKMTKTNNEKQTCYKRKSQQLDDDDDSCTDSNSSSLDFDADHVQEHSRSKRVRLIDLDSSGNSIR